MSCEKKISRSSAFSASHAASPLPPFAPPRRRPCGQSFVKGAAAARPAARAAAARPAVARPAAGGGGGGARGGLALGKPPRPQLVPFDRAAAVEVELSEPFLDLLVGGAAARRGGLLAVVVEEAEVREQQTKLPHVQRRDRSWSNFLHSERSSPSVDGSRATGEPAAPAAVIGHGRLPSAAATILAGLLFTGLNAGGRVGALGFGGESAAAALETRARTARRRRRPRRGGDGGGGGRRPARVEGGQPRGGRGLHERMAEGGAARRPSPRVPGEEVADEVGAVARRQQLRQRRRAARGRPQPVAARERGTLVPAAVERAEQRDHLAPHVGVARAGQQRLPREELGADAAERPHIDLRAVLLRAQRSRARGTTASQCSRCTAAATAARARGRGRRPSGASPPRRTARSRA